MPFGQTNVAELLHEARGAAPELLLDEDIILPEELEELDELVGLVEPDELLLDDDGQFVV